jgi:5-methylcytosine-specific restriction endonuclease McrA
MPQEPRKSTGKRTRAAKPRGSQGHTSANGGATRKPRLKHEVCKPCWELKYCPYGPLVEAFPLRPKSAELVEIEARYKSILGQLSRGEMKTEEEILKASGMLEYSYPPRWRWITQYDTSDLDCNVFGHICPVFFVAEPFTETKEGRRRGRSIPREIMLQVVRRDGQICQICHKPVPDNEVEFDHRIPFSKGGPMTADNLRLSCRTCNRRKQASLSELLWRWEDIAPPDADPT